MKYYCNPINVPYRYQFNMDPRAHGKLQIDREAADPSMILFQGKYYIFASMNLSVWVSEDMVDWQSHRLPENLPLYDYAPDVRVCGDYVYFCASKKGEVCNYYRTKDIIRGPYEEIKGSFDFWDPNLFFDDDGKIYFYWGCSNITPIWGVELEPETMLPKTERIELLTGAPYERGYERMGADNSEFPRSEAEIEQMYRGFIKQSGMKEEELPKQYLPQIKGMFTRQPFIEGPWMDKHEGIYYLQYACPGAEYNVYADGVYISHSPLGPFTLAKNNPYSYHPGGFMPGAGHGSTMRDREENLWHASTMRISVNHQFERRVGIWPAGYDRDGELFCNQNYGDWPIAVRDGRFDPWSEPQWYLLSYAKPAKASSSEEGKEADKAVNEDATNWWRAEDNRSGHWLEIDLEKEMDVRAVQINFADDALEIPAPGKIGGSATQPRYIEERELRTRWKLEGSLDKEHYFMIEDKSSAQTDLPHDFIVREKGISARYVRLTILEVPYDAKPCISGLRIFGTGRGEKPEVPVYRAKRSRDGLDLTVSVDGKKDAAGWNILWGHEKDKLYHSYQIYRSVEDIRENREAVISKRIGALVKSQDYFVRVDSFNENGIRKGNVVKL
ncbi:family 43 glycosylhydrolase [Murimonas intestini]|uniref:F5/8 type C domain-containing protein n=1 Tax=Murimonas intestini TaxID=1337051 RepID=A0AB73T619_9FIRM|nr:family 43 glycosylhydrolase [Murimonas intestini]MCR1841924.1 family 43 glycosylhydrolase [Murimonas intestini]MCR1864994.1 family 43 glycosylhydrolase [Murimonas intestini]MCR1885691.1 family 43 glycosylhydrolase [Murimonas intestini]